MPDSAHKRDPLTRLSHPNAWTHALARSSSMVGALTRHANLQKLYAATSDDNTNDAVQPQAKRRIS